MAIIVDIHTYLPLRDQTASMPPLVKLLKEIVLARHPANVYVRQINYQIVYSFLSLSKA